MLQYVRRLLARFPRPAARWSRLFAIATAVGVISGLSAAGLEWGLTRGADRLAGNFADLGEAYVFRFRPVLLILPALGGLLSGLLVRIFCPHRREQGTDVLVRAFHREGGKLPLTAPAVRAVAAVGVISCGGSTGPEGPIAALGAAIGSSLGGLLKMTPRERRIMLVAGCGAGVGAIFQCPLGGALFAASVLYREPDFETDAMVPAFISSVVGYSTYMMFWGFGHRLLHGADALVFSSPRELIPYALLGLLCAAFCVVFHSCLRFIQHRPLARLRLPTWLSPAVGGLATGMVACILPQVMDGQYRFIQNAMDGDLLGGFENMSWWRWAGLFAAVGVAKCIATAFTVGSGASGGVLGPNVFIGGVVGALLGAVLEAVAPAAFDDDLRKALIPVGMAGMLSATMRTPLAAIVMVTEMTGSYGLIVPLMLVCMSSYVVGRRWGLIDGQVATTAESPAHAGDIIVHMLESWRVGDLMQRDWAETVRQSATLGELVKLARPGTRPVFAVVDDGCIEGLISVPDVERVMREPGLPEVIIAADMMTTQLSVLHPNDDAYQALARMAHENHVVMPVVSRDPQPRFLGMLTRQHIYDAVQKQIDQMRGHLLSEHEGLASLDQEDRLQQLVMGVQTQKKEVIQRLLIPMEAVGKSLRESDFRRQFGIHVIAIEQPDGSLQCPPDPDRAMQTDQRLVAIVRRD